MKKYLILLFNFLLIIHYAFPQAPLTKQWDYRFGGTDGDAFKSFVQTTDGGFILGGQSASGISGDKTQPTWGGTGDYDYWIVKIDSLGIKQWDRDFGGTMDDMLQIVLQTSDAGFILGGYTASGISGDKTQANWDPSGTTGDFWIVKTDSLGNKQWDKTFGGTDNDMLTSIIQTADGGFIFGGNSISDVSGDKTEPRWGSVDYWIVKTDSLGNKQWDKDFGATGVEIFSCIQQTDDGGFILGGWSFSGISGNKTQPNHDASGTTNDYWIIKIDSLGNIEWDKSFGGINSDYLSSLQQTGDGGYILGGTSKSGISGDKSQPNWDPSGNTFDFWIIKTDSQGNKEWDRDFGGTFSEELYLVSLTADGSYLISGDSYSPLSGNKTDNNLGVEQSWILKIDSLGNIFWDKTLHTFGRDEAGQAIQTRDGCLVIANSTNSIIGGDKSQAAWNNSVDYWIIKFCETLQAGFTSPSAFCPGTCIDFTNLSLQATNYQWNFPGAVPDTSTAASPANICYANPGTYDVTLIASNANGSDTLLLSNYITVYPTPAGQAITQVGDTLFAIPGAVNYQWFYNTLIINGATDYFYLAAQSGDYNVVVTDANGCEVEAAIFNVVASTPTGLSDEEEIIAVPNPALEKLLILTDQLSDVARIKIYNMLGETLLDLHSSIPTEIDVLQLPASLYFLELTTSEKVFISKFVKE